MRLGSTLIAIVFLGCGGDGGGDGAPDAAIDASAGDPVPKVGSWSYSNVTPTQNTCGTTVGDQVQPGGLFAIDQASSTMFHVVPNDGTQPFTCTLAGGGAFNCPNRAAGMHDFNPSVNAVVTYMATASGTFSSSILASGMQNGMVTCAGSGCSLAGATFPCTFNVSFVISAQ